MTPKNEEYERGRRDMAREVLSLFDAAYSDLNAVVAVVNYLEEELTDDPL